MEHQNEENLKQLFERFFDDRQADYHVEDIYKGEQILQQNPAPEPQEHLLMNIKSRVAENLIILKRRRSVITFVRRVTAAAAAIVIISAISLVLFPKEPLQPDGPPMAPGSSYSSFWDDNINDNSMLILTAEYEQIEDDAVAFQLDKNELGAEAKLAELEMKLIQINTQFWEG